VPGELGRRYAPDKRDARFMLRAVMPLPSLDASPRFKYRWEQFNQDQTGDTCVANATTHFLGDGPRSHKLEDLDREYATYRSGQSGQTGFRGYLYDQAQLIDEWTDTPPMGGTSVRAGFKALAAMGHLGEYRWLDGVGEVASAILNVAPVVIGINWYESMMGQPSGSWLAPAGGIVGGHAVCLSGCNRTGVGKVKVQTWGIHYWMKFSDLARLLSEDGEAAVGLEPV
jgi:hypothetical protein